MCAVKNFTPAEEQAELEKLARMICRGINGDQIDPDGLVARGAAQTFLDGYVIDLERAGPAWCRYLGAAKAVFDYQRRREELHMLEFTDQDVV